MPTEAGPGSFLSLHAHGFVRVSVCVPHVKVAAPAFNAERTVAMARDASADGAALVLFPEMGLSAYSNEDLFHQDALLDATEAALARVLEQSKPLTPVLVVGAPLRFESKLFNCAVVVHRGRVLGVVPKTYLPNYREFYEKRQFTSGVAAQSGKCIAAYLYSAAGQGESTTDLAWDGHALIYENSNLLAESERFSDKEQRITADVDLDRLRQERMRMTSFGDAVAHYREKLT